MPAQTPADTPADTPARNRRILLARRPRGVPVPDDFRQVEEAVPTAGDGEILVRNRLLSVDPAIRGWLDDKESYFPPIQLGALINAIVIGTVVESRVPGYAPGDIVTGFGGWEDYSRLTPSPIVSKLDPAPDVPLSRYLSALGPTGLTAHVGLHVIAPVRAGETVVVSAAAGAVGSIAVQIGRLRGCRVVGIAGGADKCRWLVETLGVDAAIDRHDPTPLDDALKAHCPGGIDVYFDNVGGATLDTILGHMNIGGRIATCGMIADYNAAEPYGVKNLWQLVVKRLNMRGFLTYDHEDALPAARRDLGQWVAQGALISTEEVVDGLDNTVATFLRLFTGSHSGKLLVRP